MGEGSEWRRVPGAAKNDDWMESTARQKASARPSSSATVGRRCDAAGSRWALVIARRGGSEAARVLVWAGPGGDGGKRRDGWLRFGSVNHAHDNVYGGLYFNQNFIKLPNLQV